MNKIFFQFLILFTSIVQAQNNNSLLWEISGNGLIKKSYLYGTMHVNDKVSYHLSDSFFSNLLSSDMVANESNPETWSEVANLIKETNVDSSIKFYSDFYLLPASKENVISVFNNNTNYFNFMLSGTEGDLADYQENTVLDMFIYQTGMKYKKEIVGLESARESILSLLQIKEEDKKPEEENIKILMKMLKNRSFDTALKEYYREKNITLLDSIYKLMLSKKTHDVLIVNRNMIMTKSIDSLVRKGSLFSAVGAAHLGGENGIIEMLKKKGYILNPITDSITESGKKQKKTIENFFLHPNFKVGSTQDGMVQMPLNKQIIETYENLGSPDFTNGGSINIRRMPLNYFLKENEIFNPKTLDSLFFEKIAGDILEKKYFEKENYSGYDIKNISKTGNGQHFRFYITPLEIIAISMSGVGNYVRQFENEIFDNIKIKPFNNNWEKIVPEKGGFSIEVPSFNNYLGNTFEKANNIKIQAYENTEKAYYFLTERTLNDSQVLENTGYEHKQIQHEFYKQLNIDTLSTKFDNQKNTYESSSKIGDKTIKLKTIINGAKYYLLGAVNSSETNTNRFFNSFMTLPFKDNLNTKNYNDSIARFKIEIPENENKKLFLKINPEKETIRNAFQSENKYYTFNSEAGQTIDLQYYKYPKYENRQSVDSIQSGFRKMFLKEYNETEYDYDDDYDDYGSKNSLLNSALYTKKGFSKSIWDKIIKNKNNQYEMIEESISFDKENKVHIMNATVSNPNATQAIKYKALLKEDCYYILSTLVEKNYKNNDNFIETTFNSLQPYKTISNSESENRVNLFINDAKNEKDTIRNAALKSIYQLKITANDFDSIKEFLTSFNFKDNETQSIKYILEKIGEIKDDRILPFLEDYYKKENTQTSVQLSVLEAIASQKSKLAFKKILELLEYDLPLPDNQYDINRLFYSFENDIENSKVLFPKIFQFYSIKEYNQPVIRFCNALLENNLVSEKRLKSYKKIITTNTKLEYKRIASWKEKNVNQDEEDDDSETEAPVEDLVNYVNLIYNYKADKPINQLFEKIKNLKITELDIEMLRLDFLNNRLNNTQIKAFLDNPSTRFIMIQLLLNKNKKELITMSDEEIAKSAVINFENITEGDSVSFLEKKLVENNGKPVTYYFYEINKTDNDDDVAVKKLYTIAFINENEKINALGYKIFPSKIINEEDDLKKEYETIINSSINEEHIRASIEKEKPVFNKSYFNEY